MKKILVTIAVTAMLLTTSAAFAGDGLWIGPTFLYDGQTTINEFFDEDSDFEMDSEDLLLGAEGRLDISIFQGSVNAVYYSDAYLNGYYVGEAVEMNLNAGLYADLGIFGFGVSAGPRFLYLSDYDEDVELGSNIKLAADLILGKTLVSGYFMGYVSDMEAWLEDETAELGDLSGKVGISVLFQL